MMWACCESVIGPACQHHRYLTETEVRDVMTETRTDADRSNYGTGWEAVASWGRDGWDLGQWPYVKVSHRERDGRYELLYYVEGDVTVYSCATEGDRRELTDYLAFWHWDAQGETWVKGLTFDTLPGGLRGPFSWARADAARQPA